MKFNVFKCVDLCQKTINILGITEVTQIVITDWRIKMVYLVPSILQTASVLHVTVLVFMRLLAISRPTTYRDTHKQIRFKSIIIIWILSITTHLFCVVPQFFTTEIFYLHYALICTYIDLYVFRALPVVSIVLMYVTLIWILKRNKSSDTQTSLDNAQSLAEAQSNRMTLMVMRIVSFLLIFYVPRLIWWQYFIITSMEKRPWIPTPGEVMILVINYPK